ncbi:MAG: ABC transporter permease [Myxococcales bacterium]|nr:ABC transporter permease [Myxococcales bacterium]
MRGILRVAIKDVQVFFADRNGAAMTLLLPILLGAMTGTLFGPSPTPKGVELLVVDNDHGARARAFVEAMVAHDALAVEEVDEATARDRVGRGKSPLAVVLPPGTSDALRPAAMFGAATGRLVLLRDPARQVEGKLAAGVLQQLMMEQVSRRFGDPAAMREIFTHLRGTIGGDAGGAMWRAFFDLGTSLIDKLPADAGDDDDDALGLRPPLTLEQQEVAPTDDDGLSGYDTYAQNMAGMLCMFLLFMAQGAARGLAADRERGLLDRLSASPLTGPQILAGTALGVVAVGALMAVTLYAAAMAFFGVEVRGPWLGFAAVLLGTLVFSGGFALLLAGLGHTEKQIENLGTFAILVMSFLGGAWLPSFLMPGWLQTVALALPTRWVTDGLAAMTWRGLGLVDGLTAAAVLVAWGAVCALIGQWRFRWR